MAAKTTPPKPPKPVVPPDESMWQKYSPHFELPLASATSVFLHGTVIGMLVIVTVFSLFAAAEEASKPPRMDVVMIEGDGNGFEGLGGEAGLPGAKDAGGDKRTENITPNADPSQAERTPRPFKDAPLELGVPIIDDGKAPLNSEITIELERLAAEAREQADKVQKTSPPAKSGAENKKPGSVGTGSPKGLGGKGGSGGGLGIGSKKGTGIGTGGFGGRKATDQEVYAWRWNFNLGGDGKQHASQLAAIGVNIAVQDPKGKVFFITDLNRRPAELKPGVLPDPKEVVGWRNTSADSIQGLARELQLPFTPVFVQMFLPKDREQKMAAEEKRLAASQGRNLNTVRKTWFEFRQRNGVYEPTGVRFE